MQTGMSLELNKAFAAVLTAGIAFMGAGMVGELVVHPNRLERSAIQVGEPSRSSRPPPPPPRRWSRSGRCWPPPTWTMAVRSRTASAPPATASTRVGTTASGPNLYGIVGANHARVAGFNYSQANRALADKPWDYEALNAFIARPSAAMPGTRMAFAGIGNAGQRADVIAYLRSLAAEPQPLP
jgi:cytochrome c